MELCDLPAYELSPLLRRKQVSALEITQSCLQRIEKVDGRPGQLDGGELTADDREKVHAFITLTKNRALAQANTIDRKLAAGEEPARWRAFLSRSRIFSACAAHLLRLPRAFWQILWRPTPPRRWSAWRRPGRCCSARSIWMSSPTVRPTDQPPFSRPAQPVGHQPRAGRLIGRQRGFGSRRRGAAFTGHRYGRFHPSAGCFLRRGGRQTDLRARFALRIDCLWLFIGLPRPAGAQRGGCGPDVAGDCRA